MTKFFVGAVAPSPVSAHANSNPAASDHYTMSAGRWRDLRPFIGFLRSNLAPRAIAAVMMVAGVVNAVAQPNVSVSSALRQQITAGQALDFTVSATGASTLSYQWLHEGKPIPGATTSRLAIAAAARTDAGWYAVDVSDTQGTTRSRAMFALVAPAPTEVVTTELRFWGEQRYAPPSGLGDLIDISASTSGSFALRRDGTVVAWDYGPIAVPADLTDVVAIANGASFGLALKADGTVRAWGDNTYGQLNVPAGLTNVVAVAASSVHCLALKSDGTVVGWGATSFQYSYVNRGQQTPPADLANVVRISASTDLSMAVLSDGTVRFWGATYVLPSSEFANLRNVAEIHRAGSEYVARHYDGTIEVLGTPNAPAPSELSEVAGLAAGSNHCVSLNRDGTVRAWGNNYYGQSTTPSDLRDVFRVAAGMSFSLALRDASQDHPPIISGIDPRVATELDDVTLSVQVGGAGPFTYQWRRDGVDLPGETGAQLILREIGLDAAGDYSVVVNNRLGRTISDAITLTIKPLATITTLSARRQVLAPGDTLEIAVAAEGSGALGYQWIRNGQPLASQTSATLRLPRVTLSDGGWFAVDVTDANGTRRSTPFFVMVAPSATKLTGWGGGSGASKTINVPSGVIGDFTPDASLVLLTDGTVTSLGPTTAPQSTVPAGLREVVALGNGYSFALALGSDGTVVAWGSNTYGETAVPAGLHDIVAIAAGGEHALALRSDGKVYAWGRNLYNQISVPADLGPAAAIAAGSDYSVALLRDGTVRAWGSAGHATLPAGLHDIAAIYAGADHAFALDGHGTATGWGANAWWESSVDAGHKNNILQLAAGFQYSYALLRDGRLVSWGSNVGYPQNTPPSLNGVIAIKAAGNATFALSGTSQPGLYAPLESAARSEGQPWQWIAHATGTPPLAFQWFKDGQPIAGATSMHLRFDELELTDVGSYEVEVTNAQGSVRSRPATLAVAAVPVITSLSPLRQVVFLDDTLTLSVSATGHGALSYQWFRNGSALAGATQSSLPFARLTQADSGWYNVEITDTVGTRRSPAMHVRAVPQRSTVTAWGTLPASTPAWPSDDQDVIDVALAYGERMALHRDGTVTLHSANAPADLKAAIPTLTDIVAVAIGGGYNTFWAVLHADGRVQMWGRDTEGQCNVPTTLRRVVAIAAGGFHMLALRDDGRVVGWGQDTYLQASGPMISDATAIAASNSHSLAVRRNGDGWFAGGSSSTGVYAPTLVNLRTVAGSGNNWVAAQGTGWLASWGNGVLHTLPTNLVAIEAVAAGDEHGLALTGDGRVLGWGRYSNAFVVPEELGPVFSIHARDYQSAAILDATRDLDADLAARVPSQTVFGGASVQLPMTFQNMGRRDWGAAQSIRVRTASGTILGSVSPGSVPRFKTGAATLTFDAPIVAGTHTLSLTAWDESTQSYFGVTTATTLVVRPSFATWQNERFSGRGLPPQATEALADPDADGQPNLVEYALGSDPLSSDRPVTEVSSTATDWVFTWERASERDDVTVTVETSTDLTTWSVSNTIPQAIGVINGQETWSISVPKADSPRFFRLRIDRR